jgi:hypothetical protein
VVTVKDLHPEEHEVLKGLRVHAVLKKGPGVAAETVRAVTAAFALQAQPAHSLAQSDVGVHSR